MGEGLCEGLVKISVENLGNMVPGNKTFSKLNYISLMMTFFD